MPAACLALDQPGLDHREWMNPMKKWRQACALLFMHIFFGLGALFAAPPNIVIILADDLGWGDLACQGAADMRTPNIDSLAGSGMSFSRFYANCPVCSPTRAALLTGRYPDLAGVPGVIRMSPANSCGYLDPKAVLLPSVLKSAGYHTAIVGKWHLGLSSPNTPTERGFDFFHGFLGDMMDDYYTHLRGGRNFMRLNEAEIDPQGHATDLFTDWAIGYVRERARLAQPFFLYLAYNAPHTPIQPPQERLERTKARQPELSAARAGLVALIEHMDDGIGRFVEALRECGAAGNTLLIFTSDNGGQLSVGASNGDLNGGKGQMFEGGIRVPMFAVWPGRIEPGSKSDYIAMTMDLFPTVCEAAGAEGKRPLFEHAIDGASFLPVLLGRAISGTPPGGSAAEGRTLVWVRRETGADCALPYYAVRRGDWKLLQNGPFEKPALYDLASDPGEQAPLDSKHKNYRPLAKALEAHVLRSGETPWQAAGTWTAP